MIRYTTEYTDAIIKQTIRYIYNDNDIRNTRFFASVGYKVDPELKISIDFPVGESRFHINILIDLT